MGGKIPVIGKSTPEDQFSKMVSDLRNDQNRKVNIHPERKYLHIMEEEIEKSKFPAKLKSMVIDTLKKKITSEELINTISVLNSLRNTDLDLSNKTFSNQKEKVQRESKFVYINFEKERYLKKSRHNNELNSPHSSKLSRESSVSKSNLKIEENVSKERVKSLTQIMKKQLNRIHHPFWKLNKTFAEYVHSDFETIITKASEEAYENAVHKCVNEWCKYLEQSCLEPYKKWIMTYTGMSEVRYKKWIISIIIQEIWSCNNGYLFHMMTYFISSRKTPMKIDIHSLQYNSALLTPTLFNIDQKLQIEGHFFDSIYQMSEIQTISKPQLILNQLEIVKKRICTDIDNYHRLQKKGEIFQIDSDNIIGIVAYILCKISNKIDQIYTHLIFLRIIYGDTIYYSNGISSYMLSTIFAAMEYLESQEFKHSFKGKKEIDDDKENGQKCESNKEDTKCTASYKGDGEEKNLMNLNIEESRSSLGETQKLVSSLILESCASQSKKQHAEQRQII